MPRTARESVGNRYCLKINRGNARGEVFHEARLGALLELAKCGAGSSLAKFTENPPNPSLTGYIADVRQKTTASDAVTSFID